MDHCDDQNAARIPFDTVEDEVAPGQDDGFANAFDILPPTALGMGGQTPDRGLETPQGPVCGARIVEPDPIEDGNEPRQGWPGEGDSQSL